MVRPCCVLSVVPSIDGLVPRYVVNKMMAGVCHPNARPECLLGSGLRAVGCHRPRSIQFPGPTTSSTELERHSDDIFQASYSPGSESGSGSTISTRYCPSKSVLSSLRFRCLFRYGECCPFSLIPAHIQQLLSDSVFRGEAVFHKSPSIASSHSPGWSWLDERVARSGGAIPVSGNNPTWFALNRADKNGLS